MFTLIKLVVEQLGIPNMAGAALTLVGGVTAWKRRSKEDAVVPLDEEGNRFAVGHIVNLQDLSRPQYQKSKAVLKRQISQGMEVPVAVRQAVQEN